MSKLDEAFLKAYAKVRGTGRESEVDAPNDANQSPFSETNGDQQWTDSRDAESESSNVQSADEDEVLKLLRFEDGVVNVASFIARTATGRTRGTAQRPQGGVADQASTNRPHSPDSHGQPSYDFESTRIIDSAHVFQGPHFQPISLDLAALDVFAPMRAVANESHAMTAVTVEYRSETYSAPAETAHTSQVARTRTVEPSMSGSAPTVEALPPDTNIPKPVSAQHSLSQASIKTNAAAAPIKSDDRETVRAIPFSRTLPSGPGESGQTGGVFVRADEAHETSATEQIESTERQSASPDRDRLPGSESESGTGQQSVQPSELPTTESTAAEPIAAEFSAAWEVDRFEFEDIIWDLSAENSPLWAAVEQLEIACREGLKVLAITSPSRGQGRSTLSITLARMLAATGLNVALLDGDIDRPSLADQLRLEIRLGWGDAVRTGLSVEEVAVQSVEDGFTVLPAASPDASKAPRPAVDATGAMLDQLRASFDLIVIDTANVNVIGGWIPGAEDGRIDAALVIQDVRNDDADAMQACLRRLQKIGIDNIGLVENFANA